MIRNALEKATNSVTNPNQETAVWESDEEMILKLCGLK
jgi:hypothetical protein